jgi:hypothetical protein
MYRHLILGVKQHNFNSIPLGKCMMINVTMQTKSNSESLSDLNSLSTQNTLRGFCYIIHRVNKRKPGYGATILGYICQSLECPELYLHAPYTPS